MLPSADINAKKIRVKLTDEAADKYPGLAWVRERHEMIIFFKYLEPKIRLRMYDVIG